jgi:hypothetical protein
VAQVACRDAGEQTAVRRACLKHARFAPAPSAADAEQQRAPR